MACYILAVELHNEGTFAPVREVIKKLGGSCPINKTTWAITSNLTQVQIRDQITQAVGPKDRVFVVRSGTAAAWRNSYGKEYDDWLKKYL